MSSLPSQYATDQGPVDAAQFGKLDRVDAAIGHRRSERFGEIVNIEHVAWYDAFLHRLQDAFMRVDASALNYQKRGMTQHSNATAWINAMKRKHKLTEKAWAELAGIARTTIMRAKQDGYKYTTKNTTITKLAEAIGEPVPDFTGNSSGISAEALAGVVAEIVLVLAPGARMMDEALQLVAEALRDILEALAADPDAAADPAKTRAVARALVRRLAH